MLDTFDGSALAGYRRQFGIGQPTLAAALGVRQSTLSRLEHRRCVGRGVAQRYLTAVHVVLAEHGQTPESFGWSLMESAVALVGAPSR